MVNPTKASTPVALPFAIDESDFSTWLNSLATDNEVASCEQILQVLQTLNKTHHALASKTRLFFLNKLSQVLFKLTDQLTSAPYSIEKTKAYLAIWSCSELANGYILLSEENRFKTNEYYSAAEKAHIICLALQALDKVLLYTSQAYAKPYLYFWIKCYHLYQIAQQEGLTELTSTSAGAAQPNSWIIDTVFKHILVFSLSNSNQFTPQEMKQISLFLNTYAGYAKLLNSVPEKKFTGIPAIIFKNDLPPSISNATEPSADEHLLYIATVPVAGKLLEHSADKNMRFMYGDRHLLQRLAKILTLNRHRKHPREPDRSQYFGIIGFTNLVSFYGQHQLGTDQSLVIGQLDLSRPGELRELNFEIMPHEKSLDNTLINTYSSKRIKQQRNNKRTEIWDYNKKAQFEANATQIDKSESGYSLIWQDKTTEPRVGDMIGLQNQNPSIGFIRWIAQSPTSVLLFGVELLGINAQAIKIFNTGFPDVQVDAIYITNPVHNTEPNESIIINNAFSPTEFIFIDDVNKPMRYRIVKQLHTTALLNHLEITKA
ncbi:MAG: hypothetical protein ABL925_10065 [Methylococcales bacterium]